MKISKLAIQLGVSSNTIINWCSRYENFVSDAAKNVGTMQRVFSEDDILVLATVAVLRSEGKDFEEIEKQLTEGFRVDHPGIANFAIDTRMVPAAAVEQIINSSELAIQLEQVKAERDKLLGLMEQMQAEKGSMQQKMDDLQERLAQLQHALGRAEGELELRRSQEGKKRGWFG